MTQSVLLYSAFLLLGVFISAVSQVLLKKAAMKKYACAIREYLNPLVIVAYLLFFGTTFLSILAYRVIPLSWGPVLESTSYVYVTVFGVCIFKERLTRRKLIALGSILLGILIYAL